MSKKKYAIKLLTGYKMFNGAETAGFDLKEATYLINKKIGVPANEEVAEELEYEKLEEEEALAEEVVEDEDDNDPEDEDPEDEDPEDEGNDDDKESFL